MNPDVLRIIDFYLGVPICFVLSLVTRVVRLFSPPPPFETRAIRKALFVQLSEMGSASLALPAIRRFRDAVPDAEVYLLTFERNRESAWLLGIVDKGRIMTIRDDTPAVFLWDMLDYFRYTRPEYDICFDLELFSRFSAIICFLSGAELHVRFHAFYCEGLYRGDFMTHRVPYNPYRHMSLNFLALVECALRDVRGQPVPQFETELSLPRHESEPSLRNLLVNRIRKQHEGFVVGGGRVIALNPHPGAYLPIRAWPPENYAALAKRILEKDATATVVIVGMRERRITGDEIKAVASSPRCVNLMGETESLKELVELFSFCDALVTNDSGPAHFASLTATRIVVLFGPETPVLYKPLSANCVALHTPLPCSPCLSAFNHRASRCEYNLCLRMITVDEVVAAVEAPVEGVPHVRGGG